jgi:hypothetical protein
MPKATSTGAGRVVVTRLCASDRWFVLPNAHVLRINIHTSWYYKATIGDDCRITDLKAQCI